MGPSPSEDSSAMRKRSGVRGGTRMEWLDYDILYIIFFFLDVFDLVRCTTVCKSWNAIITKSKLLQVLYFKLRRDSSESNYSGQSWKLGLEEVAMKHHRLSLLRGRIDIHRWKAHSVGADQCRMKMGLLLTGVGDKNTGELLSSCVIGDERLTSTSGNMHVFTDKKKGIRLSEDAQIDRIPRTARPPITCLAVGMKKVVTAHNSKYIRMWKFNV